MATLTAQSVVRTGLEATYAAVAAGGDEFDNTWGAGNANVIHIKNGNGSDLTVTIATQATVDGLAVADLTVVVTAGEERFIGPFPTSTYNDGNEKVQLTYSLSASVTIAILDVPAQTQ